MNNIKIEKAGNGYILTGPKGGKLIAEKLERATELIVEELAVVLRKKEHDGKFPLVVGFEISQDHAEDNVQ